MPPQEIIILPPLLIKITMGITRKMSTVIFFGGPDIISVQEGETIKLEPIHISGIVPKTELRAKVRVCHPRLERRDA